MIRLSKSPLPSHITIKSEKDYQSGIVFDMLAEDCHNKCYICENKATTINVEHRVPHRGDPELKFDWNNLFLTCGHCNTMKHVKYDDILDPTKCDPEEHIALSADVMDNLIDKVRVESLTADSSTLQTAELLNLVYNGGSTDIKDIECSNLRNEHLMIKIRLFHQFIRDYREEPDLGYDSIICKEIQRSSAFAAFKRKIVRDDPKLSVEFADALK
jgi:hypothetical protein